MIAAFNLPPSQYQLHMQYMLPPLTPQHMAIWQRGVHFTWMRHFPLEYMLAALSALDAAGAVLSEAAGMSPEDLIQAVKDSTGVDYEQYYHETAARYAVSNALLANWQSDDFEYVIRDQKVFKRESGEAVPDITPGTIEAADKMALQVRIVMIVWLADRYGWLQGYGRPYGEDGKPGGKFYSKARPLALLPGLV